MESAITILLGGRYHLAHAIAQVDGGNATDSTPGLKCINLVWRRKLAGNCTELELTIVSWVQYIVREVLSSLDMANGESRIGHLDACN